MATTTASYSASVSGTTISFNITMDPEYPYYFVFVRLADDTSNVTYNGWHTTSPVVVKNLSPNTEYAINVGYSKDGVTTWGWLGVNVKITGSSSGGSAPYNWTYYNGVWHKSIPWAYYNGAWFKAKPWAYSGGWYQPPTI